MTRLLKYLIPEDIKASLNANPGFQWLVVVIMVVVGVLLVFTGVQAVKTQRLKAKHGRVYEGKTAQVLGVIYSILGSVMAILAIALQFARS